MLTLTRILTPVVRILHTAGRRDVYAVAARHLWRREVSSEQGQVPWVIYDFACSLDEFTFNRNPGMASELRFFHDRWVAGSRRESDGIETARRAAGLPTYLPPFPYRFHQRNHHRCSESLALSLQQKGGVCINTSVAGQCCF